MIKKFRQLLTFHKQSSFQKKESPVKGAFNYAYLRITLNFNKSNIRLH